MIEIFSYCKHRSFNSRERVAKNVDHHLERKQTCHGTSIVPLTTVDRVIEASFAFVLQTREHHILLQIFIHLLARRLVRGQIDLFRRLFLTHHFSSIKNSFLAILGHGSSILAGDVAQVR
jgi:hypothetical protein